MLPSGFAVPQHILRSHVGLKQRWKAWRNDLWGDRFGGSRLRRDIKHETSHRSMEIQEDGKARRALLVDMASLIGVDACAQVLVFLKLRCQSAYLGYLRFLS